MQQPKYLFRINRKKWEHLKALRGWKHPKSTLARRMGCSKGYISQILTGLPISHDFMLLFIEVAGASIKEIEEWAALFEIARNPREHGSGSYQRLNYPKFKGMVPYKEGSLVGEMRRQDRAQNLDRLKATEVIPASDYYCDSTPRRVQVKRRYKR